MDYSLTCTNASNMHGNFVLFQRPEGSEGSAHIRSLAWLSRPAAPGTSITFCWNDRTNFFWGERSGTEDKGRVRISQEVEADPERNNLVDLKSDGFASPVFSNLRAETSFGGLTIRQMHARFDFPVYHGIARGGSALLAAPFNMNVSTTFIIDPITYWVHFDDFKAGEVLDPIRLDGSHRIELSPARPTRAVIMGTDNIIRHAPENHW